MCKQEEPEGERAAPKDPRVQSKEVSIINVTVIGFDLL